MYEEIAVKKYVKVDTEVFWSCQVLVDFFTAFQMFCAGLTKLFATKSKKIKHRKSHLLTNQLRLWWKEAFWFSHDDSNSNESNL